MQKFNFLFIITLFCLSAVTYAQLPHTFTKTARNINYGYAHGVAVGSDGTVFLANDDDGLRAYSYNGNSFTNTAHINDGGYASGIAFASDGTVFLTNVYDGLRAYSYNGTSFTNAGHIDDGGQACDVTVGSDGTIFLANNYDGLRAYSYDGTSFTNTAHIYEGGYARGVVVASNGTVFLANDYLGMLAYTYSGYVGIDDDFSTAPGSYSLSQNYPNPFNPSTTICYSLKKSGWVTLKIYDVLGREIKVLVNEHQNTNSYSVNFNASDLSNGVYYYRLQINNEFTETKKMVLLK